MNYTYECNGEIKTLMDTQETIIEHRQYFCVICTDCSNVPVLHLLNRSDGE